MPYTYEYPRPAVTVDCVIFGMTDQFELKVLLIQRKNEPYINEWALPGGFVDMKEDLETAALRELEEETGIKDVFIEQLYTFGSPIRDPRGRVISIAYYALVNLEKHPVRASSDAREVNWFDFNDLPALAFDHKNILQVAIERLRAKVRYQPIGFELLPEQFTLTQLQKLYETILGVEAPLNKRNFRTRILKMGVLQESGIQEGVAHRPAKLYRFDKDKYDELYEARHEDLIKRAIDFDVKPQKTSSTK
ncbi:MAG: NUDIX domain-containing protein [Bacteroidota bacterium]